jgi:predicted cupin superfamily sugar epimerase
MKAVPGSIAQNPWIDRLGLREHPEGGYYAETFRSSRQAVPENGLSLRALSTSIYYLLGSTAIGQFSAWHRLNGLEESWYYHDGDDLRIYQIDSAGALTQSLLGRGPGAQLQVHIAAGVWFCAAVESADAQAYTLVSCAVQPAFEFRDFTLAQRDRLSGAFPAHRAIIERYCR